ncbi:ABC transporter permease [Paenibacillus sp. CECT 9249]|uniref:ABC transporter permease n=1 Tax=Paenibacillus sp. CECT 9249 TaxID=2845385 RepID=UPI0033A45D23
MLPKIWALFYVFNERYFRNLGLLFTRKMLETLREPSWVIAGLSTPLLYLALFFPLLKNLNSPIFGSGEVLDIFLPGLLALIAFGSGVGAGWGVIFELQSGVIERLRVTPTRRFSLLMGSVLRDTVMFIVPALLVIIVASFFGFQPHWGGTLVLIVLQSLLTVIVSAISGSLGLILKDIGSLAAIVTSFQLPIMLLSGVLLPISLGPNWLQIVAHFNPMYYVVEASRILAEGVIAHQQVWLAFFIIIPLTVIVLWWSTRVYSKYVA